MNKDENKFLFVAYEKNNIDNRKFLCVYDENKSKDSKNFKNKLSIIDRETSKYTSSQLYNLLLEKGLITKEKTEFVIWFKEKDTIKQIPVICNDSYIHEYTSYINGNDNEEYKQQFINLNKKTFWKFIEKVDQDSKNYDSLDENQKNDFMNGNSFAARFCRIPYSLSTLKTRVKDRIIGVFQDKDNLKVKSGKNYANNFGNIKRDIENSYRCFRDAYLFIKNNNNYELSHKDLEYEEVFKKQIRQKNIKDKNEKLKKEIIKMHEIVKEVLPIVSLTKNDINDLKTIGTDINEIKEKKEEFYTINDYFRLITDFNTKETFNNFVWDSKLVTKKVKDYTNRICVSAFDSESDNSYNMSVISDFDTKHPNIINKLIHEYYQYDNDKNKVMKK